jgi:Rod binding domain-containing protein
MKISADSTEFSLSAMSPGASSKPSKLHQAAQQFEALMIGEMMKSVHEGSSSGWLGSDDGEGGNNQAMGMAESQFANALAMNGGLGLARMVEQSVGQQGGPISPAKIEK